MTVKNIIEAAFNQSVYAINITDENGILLNVNDAYLRLYKFDSSEQILGKTQNIISNPNTPKVIYEDMWHTILANRTWSGELTNLAQDGSQIFVHLTITPIIEEGKLAGYMGFTLDRGQQVLLEQQILHANNLVVLGTLGAGIAHELNNPLTAISLEADNIQEMVSGLVSGAKYESLQASTQAIINGAERMKKVIEHFLVYSRRERRGKGDVVSLKALVEDSLLFLEQQLKNRGIRLVLNLNPELMVSGDRTNLESVLHNLLTNSRDAFEENDVPKKQIDIKLSRIDNQWAELDYADNAGGIPSHYQDKIFDPFFTTKREGVGTGLGLSIAKKIILEHGGTIKCMAQEPIARFVIQLPLSQ